MKDINKLFLKEHKEIQKVPRSTSPDLQGAFYKSYTRFPKVELPLPEELKDLDQAIIKRRTKRHFDSTPITLQEISNTLFYCCGIKEKTLDPKFSKRVYASAHGAYPLEVYVINFVEGDLDRAIYHYEVEKHCLRKLCQLDFFSSETISDLFPKWSIGASCGIIITAVPSRVSFKSEMAVPYIYSEAGAISHTVSIIATAQDISSAVVEQVNYENILKVVDIDGLFEIPVVSVILGKNKENAAI